MAGLLQTAFTQAFTRDLKSLGASRTGSIPVPGTNFLMSRAGSQLFLKSTDPIAQVALPEDQELFYLLRLANDCCNEAQEGLSEPTARRKYIASSCYT